jgi:hypothetical protein
VDVEALTGDNLVSSRRRIEGDGQATSSKPAPSLAMTEHDVEFDTICHRRHHPATVRAALGRERQNYGLVFDGIGTEETDMEGLDALPGGIGTPSSGCSLQATVNEIRRELTSTCSATRPKRNPSTFIVIQPRWRLSGCTRHSIHPLSRQMRLMALTRNCKVQQPRRQWT